VKNFSLIGFIALFSSHLVAGEYIAIGAEVTQVFNTNGNTASFGIVVAGGTGACSGKQITFPISAAGDIKDGKSDIHLRAYSTALTALTTGLKVDIHNYSGSDCNNAAFIRIKK
jgi:hypothetical protein